MSNYDGNAPRHAYEYTYTDIYVYVHRYVWVEWATTTRMHHAMQVIEHCHAHGWFMSRMWTNELFHTCEWAMVGLQMSHVTHVNESCHSRECHAYDPVKACIWMRQVTHMKSCHAYECVMTHTWNSHITNMNKSYHPALHVIIWTKNNCHMCFQTPPPTHTHTHTHTLPTRTWHLNSMRAIRLWREFVSL